MKDEVILLMFKDELSILLIYTGLIFENYLFKISRMFKILINPNHTPEIGKIVFLSLNTVPIYLLLL
jgi:ABC-type enterochelin transport system permease subunit